MLLWISASQKTRDSPCIAPTHSPSCHNQSCQTTFSAAHLENNIPEIRIEVPSVSVSTDNLLSVPSQRVKCYKIPPDNDLCLCEDIFQEHQAKLVNCDSEDANAISCSRSTGTLQKPVADQNTSRGKRVVKFNNPDVTRSTRADVIRYRRKNEESTIWTHKSVDNLISESNNRNIGRWVPIPGMRRCKSEFFLNNGEWTMNPKMEQIPNTEEIRVYNLNETPSKCYKEVLEAVVSSTSTSDCDCENASVSPKSTDSSLTSLTLKPTLKENVLTSENVEDFTGTLKLTAKEKELALKELDEIVSGSFLTKISDFAKGASNNNQLKLNQFLTDMLKLDLTSFKNTSSSESSEPKSSSCSEDEMIQFGCGRVAALAKHFSRMGEAGIIRGRGGPCKRSGRGKGFNTNSFRSEPNIANLTEDWLVDNQPNNLIIPAPTANSSDKQSVQLQMVFTSFGLHPIGFSMDRLVDVGNEEIILKEIVDDTIDKELKDDSNDHNEIDENTTSNCIEDIILEGNYENPDSQLLHFNSGSRNMRSNSWTQTSDSIDLTNEPNESSVSLSNYNLGYEKKQLKQQMLTNIKKISISFDDYPNKRTPQPIDINKKSISVDEIELRKLRKFPLQKHYSLVDLGALNNSYTNEMLENDKVGVMSSIGCKRLTGFKERRGKFCSSEEISKQYVMKEDISKDSSLRKWLSVDGTEEKHELTAKAERLDTGNVKDNLRKILRHNEGMGRKLKRIKKIDQKIFIVSPCSRNSDVTQKEGAVAVVSCDKVDYGRTRRNSVPESLCCEEQESLSKL